jgi:hypothetical protein
MLGFALWAMIVIIALTILIFFQIVGIHAFRIIKKRYSDRFLNSARPMVMEFIAGTSSELPSVNRYHLYEFHHFWNNLTDSLRGDMRDILVRLAYDLRLDKSALKMLRHGNIKKRFMAIATLGHMRDDAAWDDLVRLLEDSNSYLSFSAARAMALINPEAAIELIIPLMTARADWAAFNMSGILKAAGPDATSVPLAEAALNADAEDSVILLKYLDLIDYSSAKRVIMELLKSAVVEEVISSCLKSLKDPDGLDIVRRYAMHDCWFIRVQAASALGRIGTEDDKLRLIEMLSDSEWWVRYRAAKALENLPFVSSEEVSNIQADHHDRFSRDILKQAIAERGLT